MQDRSAAAHRLLQLISAGRGIHVANAVPVYRPEQHHQAGEFEKRLAFRQLGGAELQARGILEDQQEGDFALLDELLSVGLAEARRDVPVDVPNVVAELVLDDLVELHAASAEGRAILAAEHILHSMAHAPLHPPEKGKG